MTDDLAHALGKLPGLRVASRTSAYAFKGRKDAGQALRSLKKFERLASRVKDKEVKLALKRLSRTLKSQL